MKIRLNIDTRSYSTKAECHKYAGAIRNRLCSADHIREIEPEELIKAAELGRSFAPAAMTGTTGETWQSQQTIVLDIDNKGYLQDKDGNLYADEKGHKIVGPSARPLLPDKALELLALHYLLWAQPRTLFLI